MITVKLVGGVEHDLKLEMMASTHPRLMFPSTRLLIEGLDESADYRMYLRLERMPYRMMLRGHRWKSFESDYSREPIETKMVLGVHGQQTGGFFMQHGVSFDNVRISFNRKQVHEHTDTLFVRKYFEYLQILCVDRFVPGTNERSIMEYKIQGSHFIAVSQFESSRMSKYYAIGFENMRRFGPRTHRRPQKSAHKFVAPIVMDRESERDETMFGINDADDFPPMILPDGSIIGRTFGRTYYVAPPARVSTIS